MIKLEDITEIKKIIDYLNSNDSPSKEYLAKNVEDIDFLLETLSSIKTTRLKKILSKPAKEICTKEFSRNYSEQEVVQLISRSTVPDIVENFSLIELKSMFFVVYGHKPMAKMKKTDIISTLKKRLGQIERVNGFSEIEE